LARILLGVSGGIAAYKAIELARLAIKAGHAVRVIQTDASTRFVGTASFAGVSGAPCPPAAISRGRKFATVVIPVRSAMTAGSAI
jgi:phosphopantothenoylcysteine synthetase/decarboxylase